MAEHGHSLTDGKANRFFLPNNSYISSYYLETQVGVIFRLFLCHGKSCM